MNPHAEKLRRIVDPDHKFTWHRDSKPIYEAASEIERLEAELATARHELNTVGHITADRLSSLLVKRGVIHEAAISDQDGYDHGRTDDAINAVVTDLKGNP